MPAPFADHGSWRTLPFPDPATVPLPVSASAPHWSQLTRCPSAPWWQWSVDGYSAYHPHTPDEQTSSIRQIRSSASPKRGGMTHVIHSRGSRQLSALTWVG